MSSAPAKLTAVVQEPTAKHTATVIILHGFGDSGAGWAFLGERLKTSLPHIKFIFPNAPVRPITAYNRTLTPAWFDIVAGLGKVGQEDEQGMLVSTQQVMQIVREEVDQHGIRANRIVLGGFSQGCALSLLAGLSSPFKLAGLVGLSGYLPIHDKFMNHVSEASRATQIFWGHGEADQLCKYDWGVQTAEFLRHQGYPVEFHSYPGLGHSASVEELVDLEAFLAKTLPQDMPILAKP